MDNLPWILLVVIMAVVSVGLAYYIISNRRRKKTEGAPPPEAEARGAPALGPPLPEELKDAPPVPEEPGPVKEAVGLAPVPERPKPKPVRKKTVKPKASVEVVEVVDIDNLED